MKESKNKVAQDNEWATYQTTKATSNYPKWPSEPMVKLLFGSYLKHRVEPKASWKVLDVGCGFGNHLTPFLDMGCECHGIEIHPDMVQVTEEVLSERGFTAEIQTGNNRQLPYPDNTFDLLLSVNALHYEGSEKNVMDAFREFHRVLKPGGVFYLSTVSPDHEIFQRAKPLGDHRYSVQNWDFRDGQEFYFFESESHLKNKCREVFQEAELATVTEKLVSLQVGFLLAVCRKE